MILGAVMLRVIGWLVIVRMAGGHFHWQELIVQDEVSNGQKVAFYEKVGVIPIVRGEALKNRRLQSQFVADMVAYCPTQSFDFFPIPRFLQVNRLYFATDEEDMAIWKRFHGELPWFTIVSLSNEIKVLELLVERTQEFDENPPDDMDNLSLDMQRDCFDQYKFFARWALAYVSRINEEPIVCGTFRQPDEFPGLWKATQLEISRNPPLYNLAMQWLISYAEREIQPYLLHPQHCPEDHTYHVHDHLTILALQHSHWIHHNRSSTTWLAVSERSLPSFSVSNERCRREVHALRTVRGASASRWPLPNEDDINKNRSCSQRVRELSPLVDSGNESDYRAALIALNGGGSFTTATVWCIHDNDAGSVTAPSSTRTDTADEKEGNKKERKVAEDCYVSPNNMHAYMEMFFALVIPFHYYKPRLSASSPSPQQPQPAPPPHVISVGLGGGTTPNFMAMYYPDWLITSVEIDQTGVQFYEKYFGGDHVICEKSRLMPSTTNETSHRPRWILQLDNDDNDNNDGNDGDAGTVPGAAASGELSPSPCRSRVVVADAIAYFEYLADSLLPSDNSNPTSASSSTSSDSIDVIFLDVFDSHAVTWNGDVYEGVSNMPLRSMITPLLPILYRLVQPTMGLVAFHLHKDSQVPSFVIEDVVPVFGEANVVVLESGADLYVVASPPLATTCAIEEEDKEDAHQRCPTESDEEHVVPLICTATVIDQWVDYVRTFRPPAVAPLPEQVTAEWQAAVAVTNEQTEALRSLYPHHMHAAHQYDLDCTAIQRWRRMVQGLS